MAKAIALIVSALCILAIADFAHAHEQYHVQGQIYCDTCRVQFATRIAEPIEGAAVRLECRKRDGSENVTYSVEGVTDAEGLYHLPVEGEHEDEICEVILVKSPREDCSEQMDEFNRARVVCSSNSGIDNAGQVRYANALGFMIKEALPGCKQVLDELGFFPLHE
ncbi:hypothetical protein RJ639_008005 [Escallonia herrerae]|uniref:Uncharacterized protein n=1 Tax=Escallonia herrerae TaxID=1293975 RepID=A0AA88VRB5_9ASTE|nr:hypothetical protein RJ639_008005 [Escallonia herrerae]